MSNTIWKFPIKTVDEQIFLIPWGHEILTVQTQNGMPYIWVKVDTESNMVEIVIEVFGTGHNMSTAKREYLGTYQLNDGALIFHVFKKL